MGCLPSKKEDVLDLHPNVFRVVNIDENGADLCSGQLEITESDIVLYREGRESTVWPLHSLRRYGFEGEIFSFESGRRCETGEGIYAFRCRRASLLFRTLQQQIQLRNVIHDTVPYPVSRLTPSPQGRQTLQASVVHRSSVDNGQPLTDTLRPVITNLAAMVPNGGTRNMNHSPRSPSSGDILEVMPLYPRNQNNSNHATNVYQLRDFKREHNNNTQTDTATDLPHVYSNDFNRDLAMLRNTLKQKKAINTIKDIEDETRILSENRYVNESILNDHQAKSPLSPTLSGSSEHYAQLSLEQQESARMYMNVGPNDKHKEIRVDLPFTIPPTPKPVEYCNLSLGMKSEINSYANLALGELGESAKNGKQILSFSALMEYNQKYSDPDTLRSMSPVEELEVNYAILDIDPTKECTKVPPEVSSPDSPSYNSSKNESIITCVSQTHGRLVPQSSIEKPSTCNANGSPINIGYTTIDFDKTVALTSVAAGTDVDAICDGARKTRHNSCSMACGSPGSTDKNKGFS